MVIVCFAYLTRTVTGQANIREHTFAIRSEASRYGDKIVVGKNNHHESMEVMMESNKSLIIELQELERNKELQIEGAH